MNKITSILFKLMNGFRFIFSKSNVSYLSNIKLSSNVVRSTISAYVYLAKDSVIVDSFIGPYCSIGPGSVIGPMEHFFKGVSTSTFLNNVNSNLSANTVTVLHGDVWVGSNVFIKRGVNIGVGAVVAANAVVLADVPSYAIVGGVPAKVLRFRFDQVFIDDLIKSEYWKEKPVDAKIILSTLTY